jgi:hypothetical protein
MLCELHLRPAPLLFATDAMGADDESVDCGGFGVVACIPSPELLGRTLEVSARPGWTVASLDGDVSKLKDPARELQKSRPYSRLPPELSEDTMCWHPLDAGRWKWVDHITLGEARASVRLLARLAAIGTAHARMVVNIVECQAWAGAAAKGRSTSHALNHLCRRRAALCLSARLRVLFPWTESCRMPADELSREILPMPAGR